MAEAEGAQRRAEARAAAQRAWAEAAERAAPGEGVRRRLLRRALRFYVEELAERQRALADATLKLVDAVSEDLDAATRSVEAERRRATALEERLLRLERRPSTAFPPTVAAQPGAAALPDYFAFESRMRASTDDTRQKQRPYVELLAGAAPVLDAGCGRGELLALLREAGVEARGVDADADMVAYARGEGLEVEQADVLEHLAGVEAGSLGGLFAAQLVEHLPPPALVRFLELAHAALRPGGVLVVETINPLSPLALRNYFADLTHAQPLVPETLELLVAGAGFHEVEVRYANPPEERLALPEDPLIRRNVERLNELLFGPLDYAVVARA
ncbi:MAG TPA: class I SAM-dependent methyltransferase [Gaiellaceae bacterium]|nr:class I SAM-dependent methyltransferase [Gaiellaceae bacterium]